MTFESTPTAFPNRNRSNGIIAVLIGLSTAPAPVPSDGDAVVESIGTKYTLLATN